MSQTLLQINNEFNLWNELTAVEIVKSTSNMIENMTSSNATVNNMSTTDLIKKMSTTDLIKNIKTSKMIKSAFLVRDNRVLTGYSVARFVRSLAPLTPLTLSAALSFANAMLTPLTLCSLVTFIGSLTHFAHPLAERFKFLNICSKY